MRSLFPAVLVLGLTLAGCRTTRPADDQVAPVLDPLAAAAASSERPDRAKPLIFVLDLDGQNISGLDLDVINQALWYSFRDSARYLMLMREDQESVLADRGVALQDRSRPRPDMETLGRALTADFLVHGTVARAGDNYEINVDMLDVYGGASAASRLETEGELQDVLRRIPGLRDDLIAQSDAGPSASAVADASPAEDAPEARPSPAEQEEAEPETAVEAPRSEEEREGTQVASASPREAERPISEPPAREEQSERAARPEETVSSTRPAQEESTPPIPSEPEPIQFTPSEPETQTSAPQETTPRAETPSTSRSSERPAEVAAASPRAAETPEETPTPARTETTEAAPTPEETPAVTSAAPRVPSATPTVATPERTVAAAPPPTSTPPTPSPDVAGELPPPGDTPIDESISQARERLEQAIGAAQAPDVSQAGDAAEAQRLMREAAQYPMDSPLRVQTLERALEQDPTNPDILALSARSHVAQQQDDLAIDECLLALKQRPEDSVMYTILGSIYYDRDEYFDAVAAQQRALEIDSNNHFAQYNLALSMWQLDQRRAAEQFQRFVDMASSIPEQRVFVERARTYLEQVH